MVKIKAPLPPHIQEVVEERTAELRAKLEKIRTILEPSPANEDECFDAWMKAREIVIPEIEEGS